MTKIIIARYKVPNENELKRDLKKKADFFNISTGEYLDRIIQGIHGDILNSTEVIDREKQRINKAEKSINVILSVLNESLSDRAKKISTQYYDDLLRSKISNLLTKIKS